MTGKLPSGLYFELLSWARENHISTHQLMLEILRYGLKEKRGWTCPHEEKDRKFSRKAKQWYCFNCWTFFDFVADKSVKGGFRREARLPAWEIKKELLPEEWAAMIKPDNKDLK
jgi:hypothetical protein